MVSWIAQRTEAHGRAAVWVRGDWKDELGDDWRLSYLWTVVGAQVECVALEIEPVGRARRLTQRAIRQLPIARLQEEIRKKPPMELEELLDGLSTLHISGVAYGPLPQAQSASSTPKGGPKRYDVEFFRQVAAVYRSSLRRPTQAVADHFGVHPSTAASWVRRARIRGLLEPSNRRKMSRAHSE